MEARAKHKYIRISPRKLRIVADVVRGKNAQDALATLQFLPQKAAPIVDKAIRSAVANLFDQAEDRVDETALVVKTIMVDEAPVFKRWNPVSRGRAHPILKRQSHITVVVGTPEASGVEA